MTKMRWGCLRYPKTTQEIRANLQNPYARAKRRNLPTAYDDQFIRRQKSWKYHGRKHQYRSESNYEWHEYPYSHHEHDKRMIARSIMDWLDRIGCFHEYTREGFRWFGPSYWVKGHCCHCYTKLISDKQSEEFGDWCPNMDCDH